MRPFSEVLAELAGGTTFHAAGAALNEVVVAVQETGKPGSLTLTLKIKPSGDDTTVTVTDEVTTKIPRKSRRPTIFFPTAEGDLQRSDPRQGEMFDGERRGANIAVMPVNTGGVK